MRTLLAIIFALVIGGPLAAVETPKVVTTPTVASEKAKVVKKVKKHHKKAKKVAKKTEATKVVIPVKK